MASKKLFSIVDSKSLLTYTYSTKKNYGLHYSKIFSLICNSISIKLLCYLWFDSRDSMYTDKGKTNI